MSWKEKGIIAAEGTSGLRKILPKILLLLLVFSFLALSGTMETGSTPSVQKDRIWGCTFGDPSEIFLVDTANGNLLKYRSYGPLHFGDIAADPNNTYLYVTRWSWGADGFFNFSQVDADTLDILHTWVLPQSINSLHWKTGSNNTLFGIRGGGSAPGGLYKIVYEITISGPDISVTQVATIGNGVNPEIASDGDLAQNPLTGQWYATFVPDTVTRIWEVNSSDPSNSVLGPILGDFNGYGRINVAGLAFDSHGTLWGASWGDVYGGPSLDLYIIDYTNGPAGLPPDFNLGYYTRTPHLQGYGITGLSPCTSITYKVHWTGEQGSYLTDAYFRSKLFISKLDNIEQYPGWCADLENLIDLDVWYPSNNLLDRPIPQLYSSFGNAPAGIVDNPNNLNYVNYILNQYRSGQYNSLLATWKEVQAAIWMFLFNGAHSVPTDPQGDINSGFIVWNNDIATQIYQNALSNGGSFKPQSGQVVVVIVYLGSDDQTTLCEIPFDTYVLWLSLGVL